MRDAHHQAFVDRLAKLDADAGHPSTNTIADALGFHGTRVRNALAGRVMPRWETVLPIIKYLDASPGDVREIRALWATANETAQKGAVAARTANRRLNATMTEEQRLALAEELKRRYAAGASTRDLAGLAGSYNKAAELLKTVGATMRPRPHTVGPKIGGKARERLGQQLRKRYEAGETIQQIADDRRRRGLHLSSYGAIHRTLQDAGTQLRRHGGNTTRTSKPKTARNRKDK